MKLSLKSYYAIRSLLYLALTDNEVTSIKEISVSETIPLKFLEQILLQLKNGYLVVSKRGINGGYTLTKEPKDISLGDVITLIDGGPSSASPYSEGKNKSKTDVIGQVIDKAWARMTQIVEKELSAKTFDLLVKEIKELKAKAPVSNMYYI